MKKVKKACLEELIDVARLYHSQECDESTRNQCLKQNLYLSKLLEEETGVLFIAWSDLIHSILMYKGFNSNATNDDIYYCLRLLGWEVIDEIGYCD